MQIIGHRGACGYEPEDTLAAFRNVLKLGLDIIDCDVRIVRTGELVVIHDETVDRTTDGTGQVAEFTFEQLRQLDAGKGERIPLASEVLDLAGPTKIINMELKVAGTAKPAAAMIREYVANHGWRYDQFYISSFDLDELRAFMRMAPDVPVAALYAARPTGFVRYARENHIFAIHMNAAFIERNDVVRAHNHGLQILAYTINDLPTVRRMADLGVDAIFSDYPLEMAAGTTKSKSKARRSVMRPRLLVAG